MKNLLIPFILLFTVNARSQDTIKIIIPAKYSSNIDSTAKAYEIRTDSLLKFIIGHLSVHDTSIEKIASALTDKSDRVELTNLTQAKETVEGIVRNIGALKLTVDSLKKQIARKQDILPEQYLAGFSGDGSKNSPILNQPQIGTESERLKLKDVKPGKFFEQRDKAAGTWRYNGTTKKWVLVFPDK